MNSPRNGSGPPHSQFRLQGFADPADKPRERVLQVVNTEAPKPL